MGPFHKLSLSLSVGNKICINFRGDRIDVKNEELFSGKIWVGESAVSNGLVDGVSTIPRFIESEFGGLDKIQLIAVKPKKSGFLGKLVGSAGAHAGMAIAENFNTREIANAILSHNNDPSQRIKM